MELPEEVAEFIDARMRIMRADVAEMCIGLAKQKDKERLAMERDIAAMRTEIKDRKMAMTKLRNEVLDLQRKLDMTRRRLSPGGKRYLTPKGANNGQGLDVSSNVQNSGHGPIRAGNEHPEHDGLNAL